MTYYLTSGVSLKCEIKSIIFPLFSVGIFIFFLSCTPNAGVRENRQYIWLTDRSKYILLPPENIENPMDNYQLVSASYGGRNYQMNAWVRADETGIDMTLLNELGANMGELIWRGEAVSFSSPVFPQSLNPQYIIADFQLCFYSAASVAHALEESGLSFEETETGRRVLNGNIVIIEITKSQNVVRFVNHLRGYVYTMEGDFK
jgi:hypothetical protein